MWSWQKIEQETRLEEHNSKHLRHSTSDGAASSQEHSAEKITMQKYSEQRTTLNHKGGQSWRVERIQIQGAKTYELRVASNWFNCEKILFLLFHEDAHTFTALSWIEAGPDYLLTIYSQGHNQNGSPFAC